MNIKELNAELARKGISIPRLAEMLGMSKKALYSRMSEQTSFKQAEIEQISKILELSRDRIFEIFFADLVS